VAAHRQPTLAAVLTTCLDALGAEMAPGDSPSMALRRALDGQDLLVVLDGADAIDGLADLCEELIESSERFRLLCTAATVAGRPAEQVIRLGPLPVPGRNDPLEGPAVELFLARIAGADAGYAGKSAAAPDRRLG
jgi:predicted ATPase